MKKNARRRLTLLLLASCLILASLIFLIFQQQQQKLEQQFDTLVRNNLIELTHNQVILTSGMINDSQRTLSAIASVLEQQSMTPPAPWLDVFLQALQKRNNTYLIDYLSADELEAALTADSDLIPESNQLIQRLQNGNTAISNVYYSESLDKNFLAIIRPIWQDGEWHGFLRMRITADLLIAEYQQNQLSSQLFRCIINNDGQIIYSNGSGYPSNGNLFNSMPLNNIDPQTIAQLKVLVHSTEQTTYQIEVNGRYYYVSIDHLPFNNWHVVNFLRSSDINLDSSAIVRSVMTSGLLLIALTAIGGFFIFWLLVRQKKRLNLEEQRYTMLEQFSDTLLFEYRYGTDTLSFTPNARQRLQLKDLQIAALSDPQKTFSLLYPDDRIILAEMLATVPSPDENEQTFSRELRLCCIDGNYRWFSCQYKYLLDTSGSPSLIIGKLSDITDQRSRELALKEQARRDELTGIYNKIGEKLIDQRLSSCGGGLFFMIDLDNFKTINDTFSHAAGDRLLTQVGATLRATFRSDDLIARIGGDEFVIFIPDALSREVAEQKAQALLEAIGALEITPSSPQRLSASIGIAICPQDGTTYAKLYQAADQAMYSVKLLTDKSGYAFYTAPDA